MSISEAQHIKLLKEIEFTAEKLAHEIFLVRQQRILEKISHLEKKNPGTEKKNPDTVNAPESIP